MAAAGSARWFWLSLGIFAADRATKFALETYTPENYHRVIVPGLVNLVHSHNQGIAFGLFANLSWRWLATALVASSAAVIALLCWLLAANRGGSRRSQAGLALILGGAVGNLIDRLAYGSVADFLEVGVGSFHWPAFNVADSAITIGAVLVLLELLPRRRQPADSSS